MCVWGGGGGGGGSGGMPRIPNLLLYYEVGLYPRAVNADGILNPL